MKTNEPIIDICHLQRTYGSTEAVQDLSIRVHPGRCYGFFGRNGAGKTTTIKCLLNLLKPAGGLVRVFGMDSIRNEVAVKKRLAYVPDQVAFYPWMTVLETLGYFASFREHWNSAVERDLLDRFGLNPSQKVNGLSKGQKTQLALMTAICPEPELLILDEPTSGLDPLVRREFIQTVIGAYQESDPENRTVFISTHLISEFEGLIDEFTIIEGGRDILSIEADDAREKYKKIRARFRDSAPDFKLDGILQAKYTGREVELICNGESNRILDAIKARAPEDIAIEGLSLEEIFMVSAERSRLGRGSRQTFKPTAS